MFTFGDAQGRGAPIVGGEHHLAPRYLNVDRYRDGLKPLPELEFTMMRPSPGDPFDHQSVAMRPQGSLSSVESAEDFGGESVIRTGDVAPQWRRTHRSTGVAR